MALDAAQLRALATRHRRESIAIAAAIVVLVLSVAGGLSARSRLAAADLQRNRLRSIDQDVKTFRSMFQQASLDERAFRFPDSLAVAVSRDARFSVAQRLAQRAEQLGLTDVRVRFAVADSMEPPPTPESSNVRIAVADYTLAVDCRGALESVLSLVNQLPASVALQRFAAERASSDAVDYRLTLAVFESSADTTTAPIVGDALEQVAQLIPFAAAPGDTDLAIAPAKELSLARDPFVSRSMARIVASAPPVGRVEPQEQAGKQASPVYRVTTTLMAGARRAALINDQLVYVGESLPDGSKLTAVERDRVVLTDHSGVAHTVAVAREGES